MQIFSFSRDPSYIGSASTLMTSFNLHYLFKDPISTSSHILGYWGLEHKNFVGGTEFSLLYLLFPISHGLFFSSPPLSFLSVPRCHQTPAVPISLPSWDGLLGMAPLVCTHRCVASWMCFFFGSFLCFSASGLTEGRDCVLCVLPTALDLGGAWEMPSLSHHTSLL